MQDLTRENDKLRDILDKEESLRDFIPTQATVIARNPYQWTELITVNKGEEHGVKENMAVITSKGLIGKIKYASQFTSTVQLLSSLDRRNRISAVIQGEEEFYGLIEGYDQEKEALLLKRIPFDEKVEKDQNVLTSGLGGVFPEGLVIGQVVEVVPDEFGLTKIAYIKPAANFYDIDHVIIVERKMVSPENTSTIEEEEKK